MRSPGRPRWAWQRGPGAFSVSCSLRPELCAATSAVFRATGKATLRATAPRLRCWGSPPSQADQSVFPTPPSHPLPQPNSPVPTPEYLYSYSTSKYTLATLKTLVLRKHLVSYLEERRECLFCTLLETEPLPVSSPRCTSSHSPIPSTKQVHKF